MMFRVEFKAKAYQEYQRLLRKNIEIAPEFRTYLRDLLENPYRFSKKRGKLKSCRALSFNVNGSAWRQVFRIIESEDLIEIIAIGAHDQADNAAERRI